MEQVRLCAVWPTENWLDSSMNHILGWKIVWICYCLALEKRCLPLRWIMKWRSWNRHWRVNGAVIMMAMTLESLRGKSVEWGRDDSVVNFSVSVAKVLRKGSKYEKWSSDPALVTINKKKIYALEFGYVYGVSRKNTTPKSSLHVLKLRFGSRGTFHFCS